MVEMVAAGLGGQGVLSTGLIIAKIAMDEGKKVTWMPSYGAEMRGGAVNCNIKFGDDEIASPFVKDIDILIAFSDSAIETYESQVKSGGTIVLNSSMISADRKFRNDIKVISVDANKISNDIGNPKGVNVTILGGLIKGTEIFEKDTFIDGIERFFEEKGIKNEKNRECYLKGYELSN